METSYENSTLSAGGNINSNNSLNFQGVHHHAHHYNNTQSAISMLPSKAQLRCPLPSPKFVGRKAELRILREFFTSNELDRKRFALIGMGGCGKSQIASEFTHGHILKDNLYDPSRVFFVDGTSLTTLEESYTTIAQSNGVGSSPQDALLWLSNIQESSFILIDNVDDPNLDLNAYIPRSMSVHILITTRLHDKGRLYASSSDAFIDLDALPTKDAKELLVKTAMLQSDISEYVLVLVEELHCHALAVAQAGACIAFLHLAVHEYLERFRSLGTSLMDGKNDGVDASALHGYSKVVRYTWEFSYDQLPASSKDLFNLCAFLHHTGITQTLFQKATDALETYEPTAPFSPAEEAAFTAVTRILESCRGNNKSFDNFAFRKHIAPILSLSLMRHDPITRIYSIHPLILDSLRRLVSDSLPTSLLLKLAINSGKWDAPFVYRLLPHVDSAIGRFTVVEDCPEASRLHPDVAMALSFVYRECGRWGQAESLQRASIAKRTTTLGSSNEHTLRALSSLSITLQKSGQLAAAEVLGRSVLAERIREYGEDHAGTLEASYRLATTLDELGEDGSAEKMKSDLWLRRKRLLGEDHPDTVEAMHSLAVTLSALGRYNEAETMYQDVLSRERAMLGEDHPDTVLAMSNLAITWSNLGRHKEAEEMELDVLSRRRRLLGKDHPDTVRAMGNLAITWSDLGRHKEAEEMKLDVLSRRRRLLGEDHPDTVSAMGNLANTWSDLGRHEQAEETQLDVLSRRRRLVGEDHPDTVLAMSNLAITWSNLGRHEEAEEMLLDVLSRRRRLLGEDHPDTVSAMSNLAFTWSTLGRHEEAEEMLLDVLSRRRRLLGEDHPDTIQAIYDLTFTLTDLQKWDKVERLEVEVLARRKSALGEDHPDTLTSMNNLASTLSHFERYHEAEELYRDIVERRRRILGDNHIDTIQSVDLLSKTSALREASERPLEKRSEASIQRVSDEVIKSTTPYESEQPPLSSSPHPLSDSASPIQVADSPSSDLTKDTPSTPQSRDSKRRRLVEKLKRPFRRP